MLGLRLVGFDYCGVEFLVGLMMIGLDVLWGELLWDWIIMGVNSCCV